MLSHDRIWAAIDDVAKRYNLTTSGLARRAGLDPTTFNPSKRTGPDGRERWPSTESVSKILKATGMSIAEFMGLLDGRAARPAARREREPSFRQVPLLGLAQAGAGGFFDDGGFPAGQGWDQVDIPAPRGEGVYALKVTGHRCCRSTATATPSSSRRPSRRRKGDRVVVKTRDGEVMAKVLQKKTPKAVELASLNTDHPHRTISDGGHRMDRANHLGEPVAPGRRRRAVLAAAVAALLAAAVLQAAAQDEPATELVPRATRNVTPPGVTPGPEVDGPLLREALPPPPPEPAKWQRCPSRDHRRRDLPGAAGHHPRLRRRISHAAARSSRASSPRRPANWTPTGRPSGSDEQRQRHGGHPAQRPQRVEGGIAGRAEPGRRLARRRGRQDRIVSLEDRVERGGERPAKVQRREIVDRRDVAAGLDRPPHHIAKLLPATVVVGAIVPGYAGEGERGMGGDRVGEHRRQRLLAAGITQPRGQHLERRFCRFVRHRPRWGTG